MTPGRPSAGKDEVAPAGATDPTGQVSIPVTVILITKDEEDAIGDCLAHLSAFERVVVVDSHSTDRTAELARSAGAEVVDFRWTGEYPKKKQWSLQNVATRTPWVLLIDADEYPSPELVEELRGLHLEDGAPGAVAAYEIPLEYHFGGRALQWGHTVQKRSLLDVSRVRFPVIDDLGAPGIGEVEGHYQPLVDGEIGHLSGRLVHDDPDPIGTWISRHNKYSDWEAHLRANASTQLAVRRARSRQGRIFDRVPGKPLVFFLYSYLLRSGWRDGRAGFDYAFGLSWYYWLIDVKRRELVRRHLQA